MYSFPWVLLGHLGGSNQYIPYFSSMLGPFSLIWNLRSCVGFNVANMREKKTFYSEAIVSYLSKVLSVNNIICGLKCELHHHRA